MKKNASLLEIILTLPKNFAKTIESEMEDEINVASQKWQLNLTGSQKLAILTSSRSQLAKKVSVVSRAPWTLDSPTLKVVASTEKRGIFKISLPQANGAKYSVQLLRTHHEWKVDKEPSNESVSIDEFYAFYVAQVIKWARTAVFYGVASYV